MVEETEGLQSQGENPNSEFKKLKTTDILETVNLLATE